MEQTSPNNLEVSSQQSPQSVARKRGRPRKTPLITLSSDSLTNKNQENNIESSVTTMIEPNNITVSMMNSHNNVETLNLNSEEIFYENIDDNACVVEIIDDSQISDNSLIRDTNDSLDENIKNINDIKFYINNNSNSSSNNNNEQSNSELHLSALKTDDAINDDISSSNISNVSPSSSVTRTYQNRRKSRLLESPADINEQNNDNLNENSSECRRSQRKKVMKYDVKDLFKKRQHNYNRRPTILSTFDAVSSGSDLIEQSSTSSEISNCKNNNSTNSSHIFQGSSSLDAHALNPNETTVTNTQNDNKNSNNEISLARTPKKVSEIFKKSKPVKKSGEGGGKRGRKKKVQTITNASSNECILKTVNDNLTTFPHSEFNPESQISILDRSEIEVTTMQRNENNDNSPLSSISSTSILDVSESSRKLRTSRAKTICNESLDLDRKLIENLDSSSHNSVLENSNKETSLTKKDNDTSSSILSSKKDNKSLPIITSINSTVPRGRGRPRKQPLNNQQLLNELNTDITKNLATTTSLSKKNANEKSKTDSSPFSSNEVVNLCDDEGESHDIFTSSSCENDEKVQTIDSVAEELKDIENFIEKGESLLRGDDDNMSNGEELSNKHKKDGDKFEKVLTMKTNLEISSFTLRKRRETDSAISLDTSTELETEHSEYSSLSGVKSSDDDYSSNDDSKNQNQSNENFYDELRKYVNAQIEDKPNEMKEQKEGNNDNNDYKEFLLSFSSDIFPKKINSNDNNDITYEEIKKVKKSKFNKKNVKNKIKNEMKPDTNRQFLNKSNNAKSTKSSLSDNNKSGTSSQSEKKSQTTTSLEINKTEETNDKECSPKNNQKMKTMKNDKNLISLSIKNEKLKIKSSKKSFSDFSLSKNKEEIKEIKKKNKHSLNLKINDKDELKKTNDEVKIKNKKKNSLNLDRSHSEDLAKYKSDSKKKSDDYKFHKSKIKHDEISFKIENRNKEKEIKSNLKSDCKDNFLLEQREKHEKSENYNSNLHDKLKRRYSDVVNQKLTKDKKETSFSSIDLSLSSNSSEKIKENFNSLKNDDHHSRSKNMMRNSSGKIKNNFLEDIVAKELADLANLKKVDNLMEKKKVIKDDKEENKIIKTEKEELSQTTVVKVEEISGEIEVKINEKMVPLKENIIVEKKEDGEEKGTVKERSVYATDKSNNSIEIKLEEKEGDSEIPNKTDDIIQNENELKDIKLKNSNSLDNQKEDSIVKSDVTNYEENKTEISNTNEQMIYSRISNNSENLQINSNLENFKEKIEDNTEVITTSSLIGEKAEKENSSSFQNDHSSITNEVSNSSSTITKCDEKEFLSENDENNIENKLSTLLGENDTSINNENEEDFIENNFDSKIIKILKNKTKIEKKSDKAISKEKLKKKTDAKLKKQIKKLENAYLKKNKKNRISIDTLTDLEKNTDDEPFTAFQSKGSLKDYSCTQNNQISSEDIPDSSSNSKDSFNSSSAELLTQNIFSNDVSNNLNDRNEVEINEKSVIEENNSNNSIRRSNRIKTITQTKLQSSGVGLVKDKLRLQFRDDDNKILDSDDHYRHYQSSAAELEAENAKFLKDMEERLTRFQIIKDNEYRCERIISKEARRMTCDCFLTREEEERGELGCGEDCLNRLLMIECGPDCIVGDRCTNRRFQRIQNAPCKVFKTEKKGFGLMADSEILPGQFIMEYVGEVLNTKQFEKRANIYSQDHNKHYYFMALRSDAIIDATQKGNISRFINHSCDPNAETQKWTVNGELRIGFFSTRQILPGEEITFDYQFQRYGREAQKCFCESENCRGWIGEEPDSEGDEYEEEEETSESEEEGTEKLSIAERIREMEEKDAEKDVTEIEKKPSKDDDEIIDAKKVAKSKTTRKRRIKKVKTKVDFGLADTFADLDLEKDIASLTRTGLKNQAHTLSLNRLMVRAKILDSRIRLLEILQKGEAPCRRLFLDYHGLRLLHGWMIEIDPNDMQRDVEFRLRIVESLETLPIPNKTMLKDSKVFQIVQAWADEKNSGSSEPSPAYDSPKDNGNGCSNENSKISIGENVETSLSDNSTKCSLLDQVIKISKRLIMTWESLPEVFRIPKKERIEQMKEHEREADRQYKALNLGAIDEDNERLERRRNKERFGTKRQYTRSKDSPDRKKRHHHHHSHHDNKSSNGKSSEKSTSLDSSLSKEQRRQLFEAKVINDFLFFFFSFLLILLS